MQSMKESAANMAASAKAGMEKTRATVQEKVEKARASDPMEKAMATEKKEERKTEAELTKQEAREQNAAAKQASKVGGHNPGYTTTGTIARVGPEDDPTTETAAATYSSSGEYGTPTGGGHQMSALPGHGTGQPAPAGGHVTEGLVETHPIGTDTGTGRTTAHNPRVEGTPGPGYRTGGSYSS